MIQDKLDNNSSPQSSICSSSSSISISQNQPINNSKNDNENGDLYAINDNISNEEKARLTPSPPKSHPPDSQIRAIVPSRRNSSRNRALSQTVAVSDKDDNLNYIDEETSTVDTSPLDEMTLSSDEHSDNSNTKQKNKIRKSQLNLLQRKFAFWFERQDWSNPFRVSLRNFLESTPVQMIMMILTMYALYADDIRLACAPQQSDEMFGIVAFIVFVVFCGELVVSCYCIENYFLSFFFWLDLVAAISIVFDVEFIMKHTSLGQGGGATEARAGRAARAGTKAGRIVRLVRLIRLTSVLKFLKKSKNESKKQDSEYEEFEDEKKYEPTKLGSFLSQMMTKKVILAVLSMMFILPYLQPADLDEMIDLSPSIDRLHEWSALNNGYSLKSRKVIRSFISMHRKRETNSKQIAYLRVDGHVYLNRKQLMNALRPGEMEEYALHSGQVRDTLAVFNVRAITTQDAFKSIGSTSFLIFMLAALAMAFTQDTEKYVVTPIRDMTNAIRNLASYEKAMKMMNKKNKTSRKRHTFDKLIQKRRSLARNLRRKKTHNHLLVPVTNGSDTNLRPSNDTTANGSETNETTANNLEAESSALETDIMQGTIRKLARLLELGFGVAGQDIVRKIISADMNNKKLRTTSDIDFTKTGGQMVNAIFGFCIIRDFNSTLQVLQGETMIYVNTIAQIVHSIVHKYSGAANKNIGNAFLCVWKLSDEEQLNENGIDLNKQNLADQALLAFLKIIIEIRANPEIQRYSMIPEIRQLLPDWSVSLGFGLHCGWGIEGAIGSKHKIDASYLSPNVNLAARLESGTHQFHVDLLVSDAFVRLLSPTARKFCRQIDCVCVKGSAVPIGLWTYDLVEQYAKFKVVESIQLSNDCDDQDNNSEDILKVRTSISHIIENIENEKNNITKWERVFNEDPDLVKYRQNVDSQFYSEFKDAFLHYVEGRWDIAKVSLEKCIQILPHDGPSHVLLNVLSKHKFQAPSDWGGNRSLTSK